MSQYLRPVVLFNKHLETVYPAIFRRVRNLHPTHERITTPDKDFLDLDWYKGNSKKLVIISHGLEGNSKRAYVLGMTQAFHHSGYDVLAWNFRGCSGEMNWAPRFYHSGATDDLDTVVQHVIKQANYDSINLIGFSLGGNLTLKYLGENYPSINSIDKAVAISAPIHLDSSCRVLTKLENRVYAIRFLRSLKSKVYSKGQRMSLPNIDKVLSIRNLREFDDLITGPLHGFKNAADYYAKCSSIHFIPSIKTPTLVINAKNDPILSEECFPKSIQNQHVQFLYPDHGGHVGFTLFNKKNLYWSDIQALRFIAENEPIIR